MGLFDSEKKSDYTVIVGCGRLGANLAGTLSDEGKSVLVIDASEASFRKLPPSYGGQTLVGDATDIQLLREADIQHAATVVSVTNNDNVNIYVAQLAKEMFGIAHVIARLYDPQRDCVYEEFGIDTICPALLSAKEIDKLLQVDREEEA